MALQGTLAERPVAEERQSRVWTPGALVLGLTGALMMANLYLIFMWAPTDAVLGHLQRIFYFHVPMAWVAFLAFFLVFVGSIMYLWRRDSRWDALAYSAAEIGVVFASLVVVTGVIWARPIWGVWWTWDPKLTTTLVLWLVYVSYLILRGNVPNPVQAARYSAVLGIVGFVDVPVVYFAAEWWRGVHPESVVARGNLDSEMFVVLMFSLVTFTLLFGFLLWQRTAQRRMEDSLRQLSFSVRGFDDQ